MQGIDYDFWNFVFNGFTAVGTVGAVIISLWATVWPKGKFKIHDTHVSVIYSNDLGAGRRPKLTESKIIFDVQNSSDVPIYFFDLHVSHALKKGESLSGGSLPGYISSFEGRTIPAKSRFSVAADIPQGMFPKGSASKIRAVRLRLGTSLGEKLVNLPKASLYAYCAAVENQEDISVP